MNNIFFVTPLRFSSVAGLQVVAYSQLCMQKRGVELLRSAYANISRSHVMTFNFIRQLQLLSHTLDSCSSHACIALHVDNRRSNARHNFDTIR
jgi:hypothetical protein